MPRTGLTPEELKAQALDAVEDLIRRHGVAKFRVVDVARALDVSHALLYRHFPDRDSLLDLVSERWLETIDTELEKIASADKPPEDKIRTWFLTLHRLKCRKVRMDPEMYRAFDMAAARRKPFVIKHLETAFGQMSRMAKEWKASGAAKGKAAETIVSILFEGTMSFHHPKLVADRIREDREPALKNLLSALLDGMR